MDQSQKPVDGFHPENFIGSAFIHFPAFEIHHQGYLIICQNLRSPKMIEAITTLSTLFIALTVRRLIRLESVGNIFGYEG